MATLTVGLAAAGCGGSSSDTKSSNATTTASSTASLTKIQFITQANTICTQGNQRLALAGQTLGKKPSPAQFKAYVTNTFAPDIQGQITAIRALGAPSGEAATVTHMLDVGQADLDRVKSNPTSLTEKTFDDFAKLAHPYGLIACAAGNH